MEVASSLAAKIGLAGLILAEKVVWETSFGKLFCQNQSGCTGFRKTDLVTEIKV